MASKAMVVPNPIPHHNQALAHHNCRINRVRIRITTNRKSNCLVAQGFSAFVTSPLSPLPRRRRKHLLLTKNASDDDGVSRSDSTSTSPEADFSVSNSEASLPEDGYIGLFVRMLGLDNDPLDREHAVSTIWRYAQGGRQCIDSVMQFSGCINLVVNLLKSDSSFACEAAAGLLRTISSVNIYRDTVAQSGAIEEIAGILLQPSLTPEVIEQCLCTLWNLSIDEELRNKMAKSDLLHMFIKFLDHEEIKVKEAAGGVLANLTLSECNHSVLVEAGLIPKLAELFKCGDEDHKVVRKEAKNALMELSKDEYYKILIVEAGLIFVPIIGASTYKSLRHVSHSWPSLPDGTEIERTPRPSRFGASELLLGLNVQEKKELEDRKMKAVVGRSRQQFLARIGAIEIEEGKQLSIESSKNRQYTLLSLVDGVARLVLILELEDASAIARAACAISDALISEEIRISFKEAGAVSRLVQLLDHGNDDVRNAAINALEKLLVSAEVCQVFKAENMCRPLFSIIKSPHISRGVKEKTVNVLSRIFSPGKVLRAEFSDKLIKGTGELFEVTSNSQVTGGMGDMLNLSHSSQIIVEEKVVDSQSISSLVEMMKTSSLKVQGKVASILENLDKFDEHLSALSDAGVSSALLAVFQKIPANGMLGLEDYYELDLHTFIPEEVGPVVAAASRLLTKLLNYEMFQNQVDLLPFVTALRKILKSDIPSHEKEWVAACLVKVDSVLHSGGTNSESKIDVEVTIYEAIPRLIEQMKSSSLVSCEAAAVELNSIISKGTVDSSRAFAASGGIFPLVEVMDKVNGPALEACLAILYNLSMDTENHAAIMAAGAVPVLKRIVLSEKPQWHRALHLVRTLPT